MPAPHVTPATRQPQESESLFSVKRPWWRSLVLILLLLLSVALYVMLINVAAPENTLLFAPFLQTWMVCFVPYFASCCCLCLQICHMFPGVTCGMPGLPCADIVPMSTFSGIRSFSRCVISFMKIAVIAMCQHFIHQEHRLFSS